jgi:TonB family protein
MKYLAAAAGVGALTISLLAQGDVEPAQFRSGAIPAVPVMMTAGGDVIVSLAVSSGGAVTAVDVLRSTPPFTDAVVKAVRTWRFSPALDADRKPTDTRVLVDAVARPPTLNSPTVGTPPVDVGAPDPRIPYPAQAPPPLYPVHARTEGTVLVETRLDASGRVVEATTVRSAPPFDGAALDAAREWTFRPASAPNVAASPYAYLIFVFRQPIVGPVSAPGGGQLGTPPPAPGTP